MDLGGGDQHGPVSDATPQRNFYYKFKTVVIASDNISTVKKQTKEKWSREINKEKSPHRRVYLSVP